MIIFVYICKYFLATLKEKIASDLHIEQSHDFRLLFLGSTQSAIHFGFHTYRM